MSKFTDEHGVEWRVRITVGTVRRVREELDGVDLLKMVDPESDLLARLGRDPVLLVDLLFLVCRDQIAERGVSPEDFAELLHGDQIFDAVNALVEGMIDFFPEAQSRANLATLWAKSLEASRVIGQRVGDELESLTSEQIADGVLQPRGERGEPSGTVPASSA